MSSAAVSSSVLERLSETNSSRKMIRSLMLLAVSLDVGIITAKHTNIFKATRRKSQRHLSAMSRQNNNPFLSFFNKASHTR
ncbi:hypothetical protein BJX64DRAFT_249245 [Aspergillus heterothallicus]